MLHLLLLLSYISQFSPQNIVGAVYFERQEVVVDFSDQPGVTLGTPVVYRGKIVGVVSAFLPSISTHPSMPSATTARGERVALSISEALDLANAGSRGISLKAGASALVISTWSPKRDKPEVFLELISPETGAELKEGTTESRIPGYSSYEKFWKARG